MMEVDPLPYKRLKSGKVRWGGGDHDRSVLSCGIVDVEMDDLAISMSDVADTCSKDGLNVIYCDR